ncbi:MAG: hypothetical protein Q7T91_11260 [Sulfuricurvum sp.]|nr:hypothetical protein [Sulfuricurvum sp.]
MELVDFTWNAMSGGVFYDSVKFVFGASFDKLKGFFEANKKDEFSSHLETIFSVNEEIKKQLMELQQNVETNINSKNTVNVSGNKNSVKIG